jgi:oxygen-independent coproporphyrinogen III oxidase
MPEFLYIHIPFCIRKCLYCDFLSVNYTDNLAGKYIRALCRELSLRKDKAHMLKSIYIGGGTPSILPSECFDELFKCLRDNFVISSETEITVEANPGTINEHKAEKLISLGVDRLSIGIQSFNDTELITLGRAHKSEDALKAIKIIKKAGFRNFSIDLMYGIPGQTEDTWKQSLRQAVGISPEHISAYELTPEEKTPLHGLLGSGALYMPDEEVILNMYDQAIDYLDLNKYEHYEVSNFALQGFKCNHNLNYWNRGEYIGAGAGAHSFINNRRSKNTPDIQSYTEALNNHTLPESESTFITPEEALREFIFLGLRKTEGIKLTESEKFGLSIAEVCKELIDKNYMEIRGDFIKLTRKGLKISNTVIVSIFEKSGL